MIIIMQQLKIIVVIIYDENTMRKHDASISQKVH